MAVAKAINLFHKQLRGYHVFILPDNATVITYVNKRGHAEPILNQDFEQDLPVGRKEPAISDSGPPQGGL